MPKMKTKKAAAKRFKITGSGKLVSKHAYRQHDAWGKSKKQRKHAMKQMTLTHSDYKRERDLFPGQL